MRMRSLFVPLGLLVCLPSAALADEADTQYRKGMAYKEQGKVDEAIASFEAAVAARANHSMAWNSLGILYKKKGDLTKAVEAFEKAAALMPKNATVFSNLGMA